MPGRQLWPLLTGSDKHKALSVTEVIFLSRELQEPLQNERWRAFRYNPSNKPGGMSERGRREPHRYRPIITDSWWSPDINVAARVKQEFFHLVLGAPGS